MPKELVGLFSKRKGYPPYPEGALIAPLRFRVTLSRKTNALVKRVPLLIYEEDKGRVNAARDTA